MKTNFKSMMVVGMIFLGTVTTFGKTTTAVHNNRNHNTSTEVIVVNNHNNGFGMMNHRYMRPGMDRQFFWNHMMSGRHIFNHRHECQVCHLTKHQIHEVEHEMRHNHHNDAHRPVAQPSHFRR